MPHRVPVESTPSVRQVPRGALDSVGHDLLTEPGFRDALIRRLTGLNAPLALGALVLTERLEEAGVPHGVATGVLLGLAAAAEVEIRAAEAAAMNDTLAAQVPAWEQLVLPIQPSPDNAGLGLSQAA